MKYAYVYDGSKHELKEFEDSATEQREVEKTRIVQVEETDDEGLPVTVEKEETYTETEYYQPEFDYEKAAADYQSCVWLSEEEYDRFKNADVTKYHLEWDDEHKPVLAEYGKQQWIELKDGKIVASAGYRFSETCVKAEKPVIRGYDGGMYYEDDLPEKPQNVINEERIRELQNRLDETDWYAVRYAETGVAIPDEIKAERQAAREEISRLRDEALASGD
jgi:hypothetical protein